LPIRALLLGVAFAVVVCVLVAYGELVVSRGGSMEAILLGASHLPPAALGLLMPLLLVNLLLRRFAPRLRLLPHETIAIYAMMIVAALLSSFGLSAQLLPNLVGANYFATPENRWRSLFYPHFPKWLVPFDPKGTEQQFVSRAFYEGLHHGEPIPWAAWIVPLIAWGTLAILLFILLGCVAALLRRQWVDNEKLPFPLVQLPLEMVREETAGPFWRNHLVWIGVAIPLFYHSLNGLHRLFPAVPELPVIYSLNQYFVARPWSDLTFTPLVLSFSVIGVTFLLPMDVAFSFWFFLLFSRLQEFIGSTYNAQMDGMPVYPAKFFIGYQSVGAAIAIFVASFVLARPHLSLVWRRLKGDRSIEDLEELLPYRQATLGALFSFALILTWCYLAGMNVWIAALLLLAFIFFVAIVLSRCVSEVGLLMLQGLFRPIDVWAIALPRAELGAQNLTTLSLLDGVFFRDPRGILLPVAMDASKMTDGVALRRRDMLMALGVAALVAIGVSFWVQLAIIYRRGGITLNAWFFLANPTLYFNESAAILQSHPPYDWRAPFWSLIGFGFTLFLYTMRTRFAWWPFHPLGYAMGAAWPAIVYWFSMFLAWLVKLFMLRYGGIRLYRKARVFFLGLILGEFLAALLWVTISVLTGVPGPYIPLS